MSAITNIRNLDEIDEMFKEATKLVNKCDGATVPFAEADELSVTLGNFIIENENKTGDELKTKLNELAEIRATIERLYEALNENCDAAKKTRVKRSELKVKIPTLDEISGTKSSEADEATSSANTEECEPEKVTKLQNTSCWATQVEQEEQDKASKQEPTPEPTPEPKRELPKQEWVELNFEEDVKVEVLAYVYETYDEALSFVRRNYEKLFGKFIKFEDDIGLVWPSISGRLYDFIIACNWFTVKQDVANWCGFQGACTAKVKCEYVDVKKIMKEKNVTMKEICTFFHEGQRAYPICMQNWKVYFKNVVGNVEKKDSEGKVHYEKVQKYDIGTIKRAMQGQREHVARREQGVNVARLAEYIIQLMGSYNGGDGDLRQTLPIRVTGWHETM